MKDEKSPVEILLEEADGDIEKLKTIIRRIEGELELTRKERDNEKCYKEFHRKTNIKNYCALKCACMYLSENSGFPIPSFALEQWMDYFHMVVEMEECINENE